LKLGKGKGFISFIVFTYIFVIGIMVGFCSYRGAISRKRGAAYEFWVVWLELGFIIGLCEIALLFCRPGKRPLTAYAKAMAMQHTPLISKRTGTSKDVMFIAIAASEDEFILAGACALLLLWAHWSFIQDRSIGRLAPGRGHDVLRSPAPRQLLHHLQHRALRRPLGALVRVRGGRVNKYFISGLTKEREKAASSGNAAKVLSLTLRIWASDPALPSPALKKVGLEVADVRREIKTITIEQLRDAGYTLAELRDAGYTLAELRDAGYTAAELRDAGYTVAELRDAGYTVAELRDAGYTAMEMLAGGCAAMGSAAAGGYHSLLVLEDGTAKAFGRNSDGGGVMCRSSRGRR
jgi:biotin operon repressor